MTASLKTIIVTHCRFFHCYYLQERKCPRKFIILISVFERYRKLPFISTQHHCLFINFAGGKERGSRQKIVKSKNYKQPLPDHQKSLICCLLSYLASGSQPKSGSDFTSKFQVQKGFHSKYKYSQCQI